MSTATRPSVTTTIPPLENGDRLSLAEFERRYEAMPGVTAELVEGVVYMASPVRHPQHGRPHLHVSTWLGLYEAGTPGVEAGDNGSVRLDRGNEIQPDVYLMIQARAGGQSRISADGYVEGAPELVAEIASSSVSLDLGPKLEAYRRNGVREYLVWRVLDAAFDWLVLVDGRYEPLPPDEDGLLRSRAFPGLWLDAAALLKGDLARVIERLNQGLASPEHAAFVERLRPE